jgi:hypothetical protein
MERPYPADDAQVDGGGHLARGQRHRQQPGFGTSMIGAQTVYRD